MTGVQLKLKGFQEAILKLRKMAENGENTTPIYTDFLESFKDYIRDNWRKAGSPFGNEHMTLTEKYRKIKLRKGKTGKADLILTGKLKNAATGGDGWYQKIRKKSFEWGINKTVIPYAAIHQFGYKRRIKEVRKYESKVKKNTLISRAIYEGGWPPRPYFALKNGSLPGVLVERLNTIVRFHMIKGA